MIEAWSVRAVRAERWRRVALRCKRTIFFPLSKGFLALRKGGLTNQTEVCCSYSFSYGWRYT
jgi:hypothetical protein